MLRIRMDNRAIHRCLSVFNTVNGGLIDYLSIYNDTKDIIMIYNIEIRSIVTLNITQYEFVFIINNNNFYI